MLAIEHQDLPVTSTVRVRDRSQAALFLLSMALVWPGLAHAVRLPLVVVTGNPVDEAPVDSMGVPLKGTGICAAYLETNYDRAQSQFPTEPFPPSPALADRF